jgi:hypothetical protein
MRRKNVGSKQLTKVKNPALPPLARCSSGKVAREWQPKARQTSALKSEGCGRFKLLSALFTLESYPGSALEVNFRR